jgi:hypothetical protein
MRFCRVSDHHKQTRQRRRNPTSGGITMAYDETNPRTPASSKEEVTESRDEAGDGSLPL